MSVQDWKRLLGGWPWYEVAWVLRSRLDRMTKDVSTGRFSAASKDQRGRSDEVFYRSQVSNIDLDYGAAVAALAIESVARAATEKLAW